ncbi:MAG: rhodanese-like domain-containing protein [Burkholderiaceae bacterium]
MQFLLDNIFLVLAAVISGGMLLAPALARGGAVKSINTLAATQLLNGRQAILVDLRETNELAKGIVPQARHMPNSGFAAQADALAKEAMTGKEPRPVILMCAAGWRSLQSGKRLRKAGLQEVYSLDGGFDAWQQAGLPIKKA